MIPSEIKIGHVLRYAYLWAWAARQGKEEGDKDRPCLVLRWLRPALTASASFASCRSPIARQPSRITQWSCPWQSSGGSGSTISAPGWF